MKQDNLLTALASLVCSTLQAVQLVFGGYAPNRSRGRAPWQGAKGRRSLIFCVFYVSRCSENHMKAFKRATKEVVASVKLRKFFTRYSSYHTNYDLLLVHKPYTVQDWRYVPILLMWTRKMLLLTVVPEQPIFQIEYLQLVLGHQNLRLIYSLMFWKLCGHFRTSKSRSTTDFNGLQF